MNINLLNLEATIKRLMENEDRKDVEFRYAIAVTEVGDLGKYITHDPELNPNARPHGSKEDEVLAIGQALVQISAVATLRGVRLIDAYRAGMENWVDADWRKREGSLEENVLHGLGVTNRTVVGTAYVAKTKKELEDLPTGHILVTPYATPDLVEYFATAKAVVTDHGGATSHAANIARQKGYVVALGLGKATQLISTGDEIAIEIKDGKSKVSLKGT